MINFQNQWLRKFKKFKVKIFNTSSTSAELVKLFNNASRYIDFATANQFAIIANKLNQNIHDIIEMANYNYPKAIFINQD